MENRNNANNAPVAVVDIQFRPGQKVYFFDPVGKTYATGDHVIIDTARGPEYGLCTAGNHQITQREVVTPLRPVLRKATAYDERTAQNNRETEKRALAYCEGKIREYGLDMQLVSAECAFDGTKILFYFTADERVDFRELVKNLATHFHCRIELRQIGVRDKARMVGGLGICGRPFCCATFLDDFLPVSIKMAKTQNLSLNPTKISGTCGRLMCCLNYEQAAYEHLIRSAPKVESFVDTPDGRGTVTEIDLMRQRVKVQMENQPETVGVYRSDEIAILRNGKAKKTDPPIPADLAPISGGKAPRRRFEKEQSFGGLEPIKFRYSTDTVADAVAPVAQENGEQPAAKQPEKGAKPENSQGKNGRNRHNRKGGEKKPQPEKQTADQPKQPEEKKAPGKRNNRKPKKGNPAAKKENPAPTAEQTKQAPAKEQTGKENATGQTAEKEPGQKKNHRRRYYNHRKPKPGNQ